ncbi:MAG TPA: SCO family protein [Pyrinomonadaceae bacterium]|nr:SCO family protein [Pyrinomonadaceae bacterium]
MEKRSAHTLVSIILLLLCTAIPACQSPQTVEGKRYELKGKVVSVDRVQQRVTIEHGEIRGYMDAMTMPFNVKDTAIIRDISPNDSIQATLVVSEASSWLEDIAVTKPATKLPAAEQPATGEARPGDSPPDFSLVNQDGKRIRLAQYKGKALLLTFIYTRCPLPEYCTLMSENFGEIEKELQKDARLYDRTHLLSISIDPDYDTPKVLRSYGAAHTENYTRETFKHWEFASGTKDEVKAVAQFFGLTYYPERDQITHSLRTAIIAPDGKVYKVYNGNEWKPEEVVRDLRALITVMSNE